VPYTFLVMHTTNGPLHAREEDVRKRGGESKGLGDAWEKETRELVGKWRVQNTWRGLLPLVGCGFAWWAALS
jgi:hypothetical protein